MYEVIKNLREEVAELKEELAALKDWAFCATRVIQDGQETDGCEYLRLP